MVLSVLLLLVLFDVYEARVTQCHDPWCIQKERVDPDITYINGSTPTSVIIEVDLKPRQQYAYVMVEREEFAMTHGNYLWQIDLISKDMDYAVGLSTERYALPSDGRVTKGLFFNGHNLENGAGTVAFDYGHYHLLGTGNRAAIGPLAHMDKASTNGRCSTCDVENLLVYCEVDRGHVRLWFVQNGVALGKGFDVATPIPLYLTFRLGGWTALYIQKREPRLAHTMRSRMDPYVAINTVQGAWAVSKSTEGDFSGVKVDILPLRAQLGRTVDLDMRITVANGISVTAQCYTAEKVNDRTVYYCKNPMITSTLMLGSHDQMDKELRISTFFQREPHALSIMHPSETVDTIRLEKGVRKGETSFFELRRRAEQFPAITSGPF